LNRVASFEQIPISEKTIAVFKRYYEKIDDKEYTDQEVLKFIEQDRLPEEKPMGIPEY